MPKYRLHKGSGQAFVQIKGHRHYLGVFNSPESKERYARFITESIINRLSTPAIPAAPVDQITVVELAASYLDHVQDFYRKNGAPTRRVGIIANIIGVVCGLYGRIPAHQFGPLAFG